MTRAAAPREAALELARPSAFPPIADYAFLSDTETMALVDRILVQERAAADRFAAEWDRGAEASLAALGHAA